MLLLPFDENLCSVIAVRLFLSIISSDCGFISELSSIHTTPPPVLPINSQRLHLGLSFDDQKALPSLFLEPIIYEPRQAPRIMSSFRWSYSWSDCYSTCWQSSTFQAAHSNTSLYLTPAPSIFCCYSSL